MEQLSNTTTVSIFIATIQGEPAELNPSAECLQVTRNWSFVWKKKTIIMSTENHIHTT